MRASNILTPLFFAATTLAQGPPEGIAPPTGPPPDCQSNANGNFTIGTLKVGHQHKRETGMEAADGALICNLHNGILRDANGRTGSVVANKQFQFDGPPQAGAIYTGGFSICKNGSLAIGSTTQWWQCSSGPFYNLYDTWIGAQCEEIRIQVTFPQSATPSSSSAVAASSTTSSMTVASVMSSLITITGAVSTVSASAVGPSASFSGNATMASVTSSHSGAASSAVTVSATKGLTPGSSASAGATSAAAAPPAGGAAASINVAKGTSFVALMAFVGAALII